jgi:hypothetical protein
MLTLKVVESLLVVGANVAAIVTGVVAAIVGGRYLWLVRQRRMVLETYLARERRADEASGRSGAGVRSVMHLMGFVSMTEPEVLDAAFASKRIRSFTHDDPATGRSDALLFQFERVFDQRQVRRGLNPVVKAPPNLSIGGDHPG